MASICNDANGRRRILFVGQDGKRKVVRLGKATAKQADAFKVKLEQLITASISGTGIDDETTRWLVSLDDTIHDRLAKVGLVKARAKTAATLAAFIDAYAASRADVKASTATVYKRCRRLLVLHFGADKPIRDITPGDADGWRLWLVGRKLADNTIRRQTGVARQFFNVALRRKLIGENPFRDLPAAVHGSSEARRRFISRKEIQAVIDAAPDHEWRLIIALARYGGLRIPSESNALTWADVDWERSRIRVPSPKTAHRPGGESRMMPLFPELRSYLLEAFDRAEPGAVCVTARHRGANLRTHFERIIRQAGLEPWPKLFHNLRSSRQTELAERFPIHAVCAWLGNSRAVAEDHYLQVTDEHFANAVKGADEAAQKAAQSGAETPGNERQDDTGECEESPCLQGVSAPCESLQECLMGPVGLEPTT